MDDPKHTAARALAEMISEIGTETIPPAIQAKRLLAFYKSYDEVSENKCQFKKGDFVTPRKESRLRGTGEPHIVLEVLETPFHHFGSDENSSASSFGRRLDMRVACFVRYHIAPFWCESHEYEPWKGNVAV